MQEIDNIKFGKGYLEDSDLKVEDLKEVVSLQEGVHQQQFELP